MKSPISVLAWPSVTGHGLRSFCQPRYWFSNSIHCIQNSSGQSLLYHVFQAASEYQPNGNGSLHMLLQIETFYQIWLDLVLITYSIMGIKSVSAVQNVTFFCFWYGASLGNQFFSIQNFFPDPKITKSFLWSCKKFNVKTTGLVHNFIILANCWNHDRKSMWNRSMTCGVHKVTPVHCTLWEKVLCDLAKRSRKGQGRNNRSCSQLNHPS